jgi:hypothetical protein
VVLYLVLAYRFCGRFFPLNSSVLAGNGDFEAHAVLDWLPAKVLLERHELPLWNPYIYTGLPLLGNPNVAYFEPLVQVPFLIFGPVNGAKIALVLAVAVAGAGQYWLCRVLGLGRVVSFVAGVISMASGALVARPASGLDFELGIQYAYIAPTLASFIVAMRRPRPGTIALAGICAALFLHSGNPYYVLMLGAAVMPLLALGYVLQLRRSQRRWLLTLNWRAIATAAAIGALAFLLFAVQALPILDFRNRVDKGIDVVLRGTQPPPIMLLSYVVPDTQFWQNGLFGAHELGWPAHYNYIGATIFLFAPFVVPALASRRSREALLFVAALFVLWSWASAQYTWMWWVWQHSAVMKQFRMHMLAATVATVPLIALLAAGADFLWRWLASSATILDRWGPAFVWRAGRTMSEPMGGVTPENNGVHGRRWWRVGALRLVAWAALVLLLFRAAADTWTTNAPMWNGPAYASYDDEVLSWLRAQDPSAYFIAGVSNFIAGTVNIPVVQAQMQLLNSGHDIRPHLPGTPGRPDNGVFRAAPKYIVAFKGAAPPEGARPYRDLTSGTVYTAPPGLPFAFVANPQELPYGVAPGTDPVAAGKVARAEAAFEGPNRIVVSIPADAPPAMSRLVVMQSFFPGWHVDGPGVSGRDAEMTGGFLSISGVRPGERYVFRYLPTRVSAGFALTLVGVLLVAALLLAEVTAVRRPLVRLWQRSRAGSRIGSSRTQWRLQPGRAQATSENA